MSVSISSSRSTSSSFVPRPSPGSHIPHTGKHSRLTQSKAEGQARSARVAAHSTPCVPHSFFCPHLRVLTLSILYVSCTWHSAKWHPRNEVEMCPAPRTSYVLSSHPPEGSCDIYSLAVLVLVLVRCAGRCAYSAHTTAARGCACFSAPWQAFFPNLSQPFAPAWLPQHASSNCGARRASDQPGRQDGQTIRAVCVLLRYCASQSNAPPLLFSIFVSR